MFEINVQKREIRFTLGLNAAKNSQFLKKTSNKSCSKSKNAQKSPRAHMSISPTSGARELQRSVCLKSYNAQKQESRFTLGLNAAKNTYFTKKKLRIKVVWNQMMCKKVRVLKFIK